MRRGGEKQNLQSQVSFRTLTCKEGPLRSGLTKASAKRRIALFSGS